MHIKFNKPTLIFSEIKSVYESIKNGSLSGGGEFTDLCNKWLTNQMSLKKSFLTHSCTSSLEMMSLLLNIQEGDEIILPSFTFVSSANAFVIHGAKPVFVDIREDTLNINEKLIEQAITNRTKGILVVHYAGISCEMDTILEIAANHKLPVLEDAAHGIMSKYKDKYLGSLGDLAAYSFHSTKNITCGEGGALLVNNQKFSNRAEIIIEKGTNRTSFQRKEVQKYTWLDKGSSYLPPDYVAALLYSQLMKTDIITNKRKFIWNYYHELFYDLEKKGLLVRPTVPNECSYNGHIYYILLKDELTQNKFIKFMELNNIEVLKHYVPLHSSIGGKKYGRVADNLDITTNIVSRLIRLPIHYEMEKKDVDYIVQQAEDFFNKNKC